MKKTVTLGQIEHELANLFPGPFMAGLIAVAYEEDRC